MQAVRSRLREALLQSTTIIRSRSALDDGITSTTRPWIGVEQNVSHGAKLLFPAVLVRFASTAPPGEEKKKWRFSAFFLFLPCVATFGLGTWQLFRRHWKIDVLDHRRRRLEEQPIPLASVVAGAPEASETADLKDFSNEIAVNDFEFRRVVCEGVYDNTKNIYVGPRARSAFGVTQKGYLVISPLLLLDGSRSVQVPVLVNRGWVPSWWLDEPVPTESVLPSDSVINNVAVIQQPWWKFWKSGNDSPNKEVVLPRNQTTVKVHGVIRGNEQPNMFVPSNVPNDGQWFYVDVPAMAHTVGLPENTILIEALQEAKSTGEYTTKETFPIAKDLESLLHTSVMPQDHINYAVTWYTLSAATTFMAIKRVRSSVRGN